MTAEKKSQSRVPHISVLCICLSLIVSQASAQREVVLNGLPLFRATCTAGDCKTERLTESQRNEFRVLITRADGEYSWDTRENRALIHRVSGIFHELIAPGGAGYLKVLDQRNLPDPLKLLTEEFAGAKVLYYEHIHSFFTTITYWGSAEEFNP